MKKVLLSFLLCTIFISCLTGCRNQNEEVKTKKEKEDTLIKTNIEIVDTIFVYFSDKVGIINWDASKKYLETKDFIIEYEEATADSSGKIKLYVESKKDYVLLQFYPKGNEEVLTLLTYETYNNKYELSVSDYQHTKNIVYSLYNIDANPRNKEVKKLNDLLNVLLNLPVEEEIIEPINVYLDANAEIQDSGSVIIFVNTNLPDGIELMVTLKGYNYTAQDKIYIRNGVGKTTTFSQRGYKLSSGSYTIEVSMPLPSVQTEKVRKIIGNKGENLKGDLVVYSDLGSSYLVEKKSIFNIQ